MIIVESVSDFKWRWFICEQKVLPSTCFGTRKCSIPCSIPHLLLLLQSFASLHTTAKWIWNLTLQLAKSGVFSWQSLPLPHCCRAFLGGCHGYLISLLNYFLQMPAPCSMKLSTSFVVPQSGNSIWQRICGLECDKFELLIFFNIS